MTADLHDLLEDAVSDVEPRDRLAAIRRRARGRRRRRVAVLGAAAGLAVACTAVAVVLTSDSGETGPDVADDPTPVAPSASDPAATTGPDDNPTRAVALYFVGDTPAGPRLFREFRQVPHDDQPDGGFRQIEVFNSALEALRRPDDPDYRTSVAPTGILSAQVTEGVLAVYLTGPRPAPLALQQMAFTLAAAAGDLPMSWQTEDGDVFEVDRDPSLLADVSISDPVEGRTVRGSFTARGVALSFEGNVPWRIEDDGGRVVAEGFATAPGSYDQLNPWETRIEVSDLPPGTYTFVASTDDPSGGTEGFGPTSDTRTIVVE